MKEFSRIVVLLSFLSACSSTEKLQQGNALVADPELVKPVAQCENSREDSQRYVAFLKQWHLSPKANTVLSDPRTFDQFENQYAIYKQIEKWVLAGALDTVVVEGCEGEIKAGFTTNFNGQTLEALSSLAPEELDTALTQLGIKLKARFGDQLKVVCGDDEKLIQEHGLALSDIRGFAGIYERAIQTQRKDLKAYARYMSTAREVLKVGQTTSDKQVLTLLRQRIRERLDQYEELLHLRNDSFLKVMQQLDEKTIAVVLGGLHTEDFYDQLTNRGDSCDFYEPAGYLANESRLLDALREKYED